MASGAAKNELDVKFMKYLCTAKKKNAESFKRPSSLRLTEGAVTSVLQKAGLQTPMQTSRL